MKEVEMRIIAGFNERVLASVIAFFKYFCIVYNGFTQPLPSFIIIFVVKCV
jgi:hypothetical protein